MAPEHAAWLEDPAGEAEAPPYLPARNSGSGGGDDAMEAAEGDNAGNGAVTQGAVRQEFATHQVRLRMTSGSIYVLD